MIKACVSIIIKTENRITISARTKEFGFDVRSQLLVITKGTKLTFFKL